MVIVKNVTVAVDIVEARTSLRSWYANKEIRRATDDDIFKMALGTTVRGVRFEIDGELTMMERLIRENSAQTEESDIYNPFNYVSNETDIRNMVRALIKVTTPPKAIWPDPYLHEKEIALLEACCFYLQSERKPEDRNFAALIALLRDGIVDKDDSNADCKLDLLFKDLKAKKPRHPGVHAYEQFRYNFDGRDMVNAMCREWIHCIESVTICAQMWNKDLDEFDHVHHTPNLPPFALDELRYAVELHRRETQND